ncbi:hypothetical protein ACOQFV_20765 [Nocardiopsis changdeensis]|uniref:Uncharacterized protein n=1 Tax=Nocardiopsis changdeensis TaxID=2831969 RepID=A0ABX8BIS1_9ACTN|nr:MULTISPECIES: hypothetical protein [Nocardiopsis]QUX20841.1 hypothetical protein KGD84_20460 [Nocardiopsis changdeensis]QYX36773.1 hypothetical protein K1J57_29915 [Nocardiopsis sp. MT53]
MEGRNGVLMETGAYWLLYVVSVCGALMHWRLGNEELAAICGAAAVLAALLIAARHRDDLAAHR